MSKIHNTIITKDWVVIPATTTKVTLQSRSTGIIELHISDVAPVASETYFFLNSSDPPQTFNVDALDVIRARALTSDQEASEILVWWE